MLYLVSLSFAFTYLHLGLIISVEMINLTISYQKRRDLKARTNICLLRSPDCVPDFSPELYIEERLKNRPRYECETHFKLMDSHPCVRNLNIISMNLWKFSAKWIS